MVILIDQPLRAALCKPDIIGQMAKWALELIKFDLLFRHRLSIRAQVLADFIMECNIPNEESTEVEASALMNEHLENQWMLHVNGFLNFSSLRARLILTNPEGGIF